MSATRRPLVIPRGMYLQDIGEHLFTAVVTAEKRAPILLGAFSSRSKEAVNGPRVAHEYDKEDPDRLRNSPKDV